jgi:hypothetical protein
VAVEGRGIHTNRGSGENGTEVTGTMLFTLARTARAQPYAAIGGGIYRTSFDLGDMRFFGGMNSVFAGGTPFSVQGYGMMGSGYQQFPGNPAFMWQHGPNGLTFATNQMPMFYANRFGAMNVPANGRWGMRSFTDPALTFGGGLRIDVTDRLYVAPDVRALAVFADGDHLTMVTMNVGFGIRF